VNRYATIVSALLVAAAAARPAHADDITTYGAGLRSCQAYLDARNAGNGAEVTFVDWLSGYFSAVNRTSSHRNNVLGLADLKVTLGRLDETCRAAPHRRFAEAAAIMVLGAKPGPAAHALDATTYGSADKACRLFIEAREQRQTEYWAEFLYWLGGYLSGVNAVSPRTNNVLGAAELGDALQWLDGFCNAHPITSFGTAVDVLVAASGDPQRRPAL
jgi:hypothetical protein